MTESTPQTHDLDDVSPPPEPIAARLAGVQARVASACETAGRQPGSVTLIAVSKYQPPSAIRVAYAAGHRDFGESYAKEFRDKRLALQDLADIRWHFIGHLQRNKMKWIVGQVHLHHAVDDMVGLDELTRRAWAQGITQDVLLQVNLSAEPSKRGCAESDLMTMAQVLLRSPGVRWRGLMTLPPPEQDPSLWFERLAAAQQRLRQTFAAELAAQNNDLTILSMGMSGDFADAITAGATHIRVGTAIFGARPLKKPS